MDFSHHFTHNKKLLLQGWLLLIILILINLLSVKHFNRFDLTEDSKYKISESTENVIAKLDDIITIKVYLSKKLPPHINTSAQYLKDLLTEYESISNGNIRITYIDPSADANAAQESASIGIPQIQMEILEKDKYQIQNGYFGVAIFYAGNTEVIPVIQNLNSLEYDLTSKIKKVAATNIKKIGFLSGHEEKESTNGYQAISESLKENYEVKNINLANGETIDTDTLIIGGPKNISKEDLQKVKDFLSKGGKVILLLDSINIGDSLQAEPIDQTNINEFLAEYGVSVNTDLIYDKYHENASFSQGFMSFLLPYPLFPKLINANFDQSNQITSTLTSVVTPWVSSLNIETKENIKVEKLLNSSEFADHLVESFNLDPQQKFVLNDPKQFNIGVLINDNLIVVSDSDFISDNFLKSYQQNLSFILNSVDYLTLDPDLIAIRSKSFEDNPVKPIQDNFNVVIKFIGILLSPIVLTIYGLLRMKKRKNLLKHLTPSI